MCVGAVSIHLLKDGLKCYHADVFACNQRLQRDLRFQFSNQQLSGLLDNFDMFFGIVNRCISVLAPQLLSMVQQLQDFDAKIRGRFFSLCLIQLIKDME